MLGWFHGESRSESEFQLADNNYIRNFGDYNNQAIES